MIHRNNTFNSENVEQIFCNSTLKGEDAEKVVEITLK